MTHTVHLRPSAEKDIEDAASWYEQQRRGLGQDFLDEVWSTLSRIAELPSLYPVIHRRARRALTHSFPFGIYYRVEDEMVVVVAVMHGSRHPGRWKHRT